jgi:hypothetical protein
MLRNVGLISFGYLRHRFRTESSADLLRNGEPAERCGSSCSGVSAV